MDAAREVEEWSVTLTGVPLWLLREYAQEIGGQRGAEDVVRGPDWQLALEQAEDYVIGSLRVGRVRLQLTGTPEGVAAARRALEPKLLRAGG